jgi:tetratricopeptide (TPR) repeat protein
LGGYKRKTPLEIANAVKALRRYSLVNARSADIVVHRLLQECICSNAEEKEDQKLETTAMGVIHRLFQNEAFNYHRSELAPALLPHVRVVTRPERLATSTNGVHLLTMLARFLDEHGSYSEAASILEEAERRCDRGKVERFIALTVRTKLAAVYRVMHRPEDAHAAIGRASEIAEKLFPLISDEDFVVMTEFLNTAAVLATEGRDPELAVSLLRRALGILEDREFMLGIVALTHANLGSALGKLGRHEEAIEQLKLAIARDRLSFDHSHPIVAQRLAALGTAYRDAGRLSEARGAFHEALQIHVAAHGEKHPVTLLRLANVAQVDLMLKNAQAAFESYDQALATALTVGLRTVDMAALRNGRAMALELLGRFDEALAEIDIAITLARTVDDQHRWVYEENRAHVLEAARLKGVHVKANRRQ